MSDLVFKAQRLAHHLHAGQKRRGGDPYIYHPMRVAHRAVMLKLPIWVVAGAWLHDVLEDSNIPASELSKQTGVRTAKLVEELTNPSKGSKLPRAERKKMDREHIARASHYAKVLKLLDRIDNIRELPADDFAEVYKAETRLLCEEISGEYPIPELKKELTNLLGK